MSSFTDFEIVDTERSNESPSQPEVKVGEKVKIRKIPDVLKKAMEPEDYFYLKEFENKVGTISEQAQSKSGAFSYRVDFNENRFGYFYSRDFVLADKG